MLTHLARWSRGLALVAVTFATSQVARAQHDDWHNAVFSSFHHPGDLNTATIDGSASCQATPHPDVWWTYRPWQSGIVQLQACAGSSPQGSPNPLLSVHTGGPGTAANEIACNDDGAGTSCAFPNSSLVTLPVTGGELYFVRVSTSDGNLGFVWAQIRSGPAPASAPNHTWQAACDVSPGLIHGSTFHATTAWYRYTPAVSGPAFAETCGLTAADTLIVLRQGATQLALDDDNCGYQSRVSWNAVAGVEYQIGHTYAWGPIDALFNMRISGPPSAEDDCASAPTIGEGVRWLSFENTNVADVATCDIGPLQTRWYRYVAPAAGLLTVSTLGTDDGVFPDAGEDTLISLHSGCPATSANQIVCNDAAATSGGLDTGQLADASASILVASGQSVVIRVARLGPGPTGSNVLTKLNVTLDSAAFSLCAGDGSATPCPFFNFGASGHGCPNSQDASGALLGASGQASVSNDTLALHGSHMPATGTALYVQGTMPTNNGAGNVFGDGLRCVSGTIRRLGVRTSAGGASNLGFGHGVQVSLAGLIPPSGGSRLYQVWYRDAGVYCTNALFNFTNGLSIAWTP